jgi:hypothetical protein
MTTPELRFRQIHLDFHTSEAISQIGADFDAEIFAATLQTDGRASNDRFDLLMAAPIAFGKDLFYENHCA